MCTCLYTDVVSAIRTNRGGNQLSRSLSAAVAWSSYYYYQGDSNSLPTWATVLLISLIVLGTLAGIVGAIVGIVVHMKGKETRIAYPAKTAKQVAKDLDGTFMYGVGKVLQGSFGVSGDHHDVREHYIDMGDDFPRLASEKGVWVPLGLAPFSTGVNRYLLNVVAIARPYGSLSAYELRYDDPVSDWHLVMVYDIAPAPGAQDNPQVRRDVLKLQQVMASSVFQYQPQTVWYQGHVILMLADCTPAGLKRHYEALRDLDSGPSRG